LDPPRSPILLGVHHEEITVHLASNQGISYTQAQKHARIESEPSALNQINNKVAFSPPDADDSQRRYRR
jgi:hypothetical protein